MTCTLVALMRTPSELDATLAEYRRILEQRRFDAQVELARRSVESADGLSTTRREHP